MVGKDFRVEEISQVGDAKDGHLAVHCPLGVQTLEESLNDILQILADLVRTALDNTGQDKEPAILGLLSGPYQCEDITPEQFVYFLFGQGDTQAFDHLQGGVLDGLLFLGKIPFRTQNEFA
jgi:hypothetical protein